MLSKIVSGAIAGINGYLVDVEVDISQGLPAFDIVGLPDSAVKESKDRVRTAIKNTGISFPVKHITINLAPADTRKAGPVYDLPIAVGILTCIDVINIDSVRDIFFIGELSLDGSLRAVNGVLPMINTAWRTGYKKAILPINNQQEGALVKGMQVMGVKNLTELIEIIKKNIWNPIVSNADEAFKSEVNNSTLDFGDVKGQDSVKRALEIAATGYHNILMIGPPGSGKTMMAKRLPSILPELTFKESLEITELYSIAGLLDSKQALITKRPFRSPHHSASHASLVGGGRIPMPGEVSLSHHGVLFLDELAEFQKKTLEMLRQPLEDRKITVSRVNGVNTYPSSFLLVASMNPCPCGYYGSTSNKCHCTQNEISNYLGRISGPLLDRIDIQVEAPFVDYTALQINRASETSAQIRGRISSALLIQEKRYKNENVRFNSELSAPQIEKFCSVDKSGNQLLKKAFDKMKLSARSYHKILKLARTIADLDKKENIEMPHLAEAIQYRGLDRKYW